MNKNSIIKLTMASVIFLGAASANATSFWKIGRITQTLTDHHYGQCMVHLDVPIGNGCPANGWVSLDCKGTFYPKGEGDRKFSTALAASFANKKVGVYVDNTKKHNSYCVARRVDVYMK